MHNFFWLKLQSRVCESMKRVKFRLPGHLTKRQQPDAFEWLAWWQKMRSKKWTRKIICSQLPKQTCFTKPSFKRWMIPSGQRWKIQPSNNRKIYWFKKRQKRSENWAHRKHRNLEKSVLSQIMSNRRSWRKKRKLTKNLRKQSVTRMKNKKVLTRATTSLILTNSSTTVFLTRSMYSSSNEKLTAQVSVS